MVDSIPPTGPLRPYSSSPGDQAEWQQIQWEFNALNLFQKISGDKNNSDEDLLFNQVSAAIQSGQNPDQVKDLINALIDVINAYHTSSPPLSHFQYQSDPAKAFEGYASMLESLFTAGANNPNYKKLDQESFADFALTVSRYNGYVESGAITPQEGFQWMQNSINDDVNPLLKKFHVQIPEFPVQ